MAGAQDKVAVRIAAELGQTRQCLAQMEHGLSDVGPRPVLASTGGDA